MEVRLNILLSRHFAFSVFFFINFGLQVEEIWKEVDALFQTYTGSPLYYKGNRRKRSLIEALSGDSSLLRTTQEFF